MNLKTIETPEVKKFTAKPILRWAGSKKKLLPLLCAATPPNINKYVEAFAGSSILSLSTTAKSRVLNDLNTDLVDAYRVLRRSPERLWSSLTMLPDDSETYYRVRDLDAMHLNAFEKAARFIYLNRFCFNGVYRTNKNGHFNVSRGLGNLKIPDKETFIGFASHIKKAELLSEDFALASSRAGADDFLYLDPPYALGEKRDRGEYGCDSFKERDEERLIAAMKSASKRGSRVLLSYSPSSNVISALKGWRVTHLQVNRHVAGFVSARRSASEVLISNYDWS